MCSHEIKRIIVNEETCPICFTRLQGFRLNETEWSIFCPKCNYERVDG